MQGDVINALYLKVRFLLDLKQVNPYYLNLLKKGANCPVV